MSLFPPLQTFFLTQRQSRYHGGWLAPNIYFLGHAGCIQLNGIRIAGISGIYNDNHYKLGTRCFSCTLHNTYLNTRRQLRTPAVRPQYNAKYLPHARVQHQSAVSCEFPLPSSPFFALTNSPSSHPRQFSSPMTGPKQSNDTGTPTAFLRSPHISGTTSKPTH